MQSKSTGRGTSVTGQSVRRRATFYNHTKRRESVPMFGGTLLCVQRQPSTPTVREARSAARHLIATTHPDGGRRPHSQFNSPYESSQHRAPRKATPSRCARHWNIGVCETLVNQPTDSGQQCVCVSVRVCLFTCAYGVHRVFRWVPSRAHVKRVFSLLRMCDFKFKPKWNWNVSNNTR